MNGEDGCLVWFGLHVCMYLTWTLHYFVVVRVLFCIVCLEIFRMHGRTYLQRNICVPSRPHFVGHREMQATHNEAAGHDEIVEDCGAAIHFVNAKQGVDEAEVPCSFFHFVCDGGPRPGLDKLAVGVVQHRLLI